MKKHCLKCDKEYNLTQFSFDSGYCHNCKPSFWSLPSLEPSTPAETKSLLIGMIGIHIFLFLFSAMLLVCGAISNPAMFYFSITTVYLFAKLTIWGRAKVGYPSLKIMQRVAILLMPFYGFPIFFAIWLTIRSLIFKDYEG